MTRLELERLGTLLAKLADGRDDAEAPLLNISYTTLTIAAVRRHVADRLERREYQRKGRRA